MSRYKQIELFNKKNPKKNFRVVLNLYFIVHTSSALYFDLLTTIEIMTLCRDFQLSEEVYEYFDLYFYAKNVVKTICAYLMS